MKKELLNQLRLERIEVIQQACLNYANKNSFCSDCVSSCPVSAIEIVNQTPTINQGKCIDCGACISQCSVFAIDHVQISYQEVSKQIADHSSANVTCKEYEEYQKGIKIPCYLYLDIALLLQFKNRKEITLHIGHCSHCEKGDYNAIHGHIEKLKNQLADIQCPLNINLENKWLDKENDDQVVKGLSRRELLGMLSFKNLKQLLFEEEEIEDTEVEMELSIRDRVLFKKDKINTFIRNNSFTHTKKPLPEKYFLKIDPIDQCRGCDICQQICPTNAIRWVDDELNGISKLHFSQQACISCKKCVVCPDKAIQFKSVYLDEYKQNNTIVLKSLNLRQCHECGETFRTDKEVNTCEFCEANKQKDPSRFFA